MTYRQLQEARKLWESILEDAPLCSEVREVAFDTLLDIEMEIEGRKMDALPMPPALVENQNSINERHNRRDFFAEMDIESIN